MSYIAAFGAALPSRVATNEELGRRFHVRAEWIREISGIDERRWADEDVSVADLGVLAAEDCLAKGGAVASELGLILAASGTSPRRFPGPASEIAARLGLSETPAIDLPLASAGGLFGMVLASQLAPHYGPVLVVASEIMSRVAAAADPGSGVLFGDGAGACLIRPDRGLARIRASRLATDGSFAGDLSLDWESGFRMDGRTVILQAARKLPRIIREVLAEVGLGPEAVRAFVLHQANQNLLDRVADALGVTRDRFYTNIARLGNTSSASLLIAADEWQSQGFPLQAGERVCFAAFGAGFQWGALVAEAVDPKNAQFC